MAISIKAIYPVYKILNKKSYFFVEYFKIKNKIKRIETKIKR